MFVFSITAANKSAIRNATTITYAKEYANGEGECSYFRATNRGAAAVDIGTTPNGGETSRMSLEVSWRARSSRGSEQ